MDNTPQHQHDCTECTFLGTLESNDLYFCNQSFFGPTVIARYGNNGQDYISGLSFSEPFFDLATNQESKGVPELIEARARAESLELL